jgi:hypothetical protein
MARPSHLRIVPFDPNDYSLGEALVKQNQEAVSDVKFIGAALSLAFQWPERTMAALVLPGKAPISITLDYDREDRSPSELWVRLDAGAEKPSLSEKAELIVRWETFRQCYEFRATILAAIPAAPVESPWHFIVGAPETLFVYKRRFPRVLVTQELRENLPACSARIGNEPRDVNPDVLEIGTKGIKVRNFGLRQGDIFNLKMGAEDVPVAVERLNGEEAILGLNPSTFNHVGAIFEYYRAAAMPNLRHRSEFAIDRILELYHRSNYLGKFKSGEDPQKRLDDIKKSWAAVGNSPEFTADYIVVDDAGEPTGASSTSLSFKFKEKSVWAFHQLCAQKNPNLLEQSGQLYTWRAEYLAARTEDLDVIGWFDSKSRWLERIYVKFAFHKYRMECLFPVAVYRKQVFKGASGDSLPMPETESLAYGEARRIFHDANDQIAGLNPKYLNASGILNAVIDFSKKPLSSNAEKTAQSVLAKAEAESELIEFTGLGEASPGFLSAGAEKVLDVDRMFFFSKDGLVDFIASVEHSVAVTSRKKLNGQSGEAL